MRPPGSVSKNRTLLVFCAIGVLCASSGLVAAQASGKTPPNNESPRQGGFPGSVDAPSTFGGATRNQERKRNDGEIVSENGRRLDSPRSRGAKPEYHMWLKKCWRGGGVIAMAFPPRSTLPSYFNPHWTRVSMRFCADVQQPASQ